MGCGADWLVDCRWAASRLSQPPDGTGGLNPMVARRPGFLTSRLRQPRRSPAPRSVAAGAGDRGAEVSRSRCGTGPASATAKRRTACRPNGRPRPQRVAPAASRQHADRADAQTRERRQQPVRRSPCGRRLVLAIPSPPPGSAHMHNATFTSTAPRSSKIPAEAVLVSIRKTRLREHLRRTPGCSLRGSHRLPRNRTHVVGGLPIHDHLRHGRSYDRHHTRRQPCFD